MTAEYKEHLSVHVLGRRQYEESKGSFPNAFDPTLYVVDDEPRYLMAYGDGVWYSDDMASWRKCLDSQSDHVACLGGACLASGPDGQWTSTDGVNWASADNNGNWRACAAGNGLFLSLGSNYGGSVCSSDDGFSWTGVRNLSYKTNVDMKFMCGSFYGFTRDGYFTSKDMVDLIGGRWYGAGGNQGYYYRTACAGGGEVRIFSQNDQGAARFDRYWISPEFSPDIVDLTGQIDPAVQISCSCAVPKTPGSAECAFLLGTSDGLLSVAGDGSVLRDSAYAAGDVRGIMYSFEKRSTVLVLSGGQVLLHGNPDPVCQLGLSVGREPCVARFSKAPSAGWSDFGRAALGTFSSAKCRPNGFRVKDQAKLSGWTSPDVNPYYRMDYSYGECDEEDNPEGLTGDMHRAPFNGWIYVQGTIAAGTSNNQVRIYVFDLDGNGTAVKWGNEHRGAATGASRGFYLQAPVRKGQAFQCAKTANVTISVYSVSPTKYSSVY